jgi:hypothetical protein
MDLLFMQIIFEVFHYVCNKVVAVTYVNVFFTGN